MACATASAGGNTTVAGWNTEPLCTSSCSATCDAAALIIAAAWGLVLARRAMTSPGPRAGDGRAEPVDEQVFGAAQHGRRDVFQAQPGSKSGQLGGARRMGSHRGFRQVWSMKGSQRIRAGHVPAFTGAPSGVPSLSAAV